MYEIVNYNELYMPRDQSRHPINHADWVKLPIKPKGIGLQTLFKYKRGLEVFGIWCLLLEATTCQKPENRGKLLNHKDQPASTIEIALSISLENKVKLIEYALSVLTEMGWITCVGIAGNCAPPAEKSVSESRVEYSRVEKSRVEYTSDFEKFWSRFKGRWNPDKDKYIKVGKFEAFEEWEKLTAEEKKKAIDSATKVEGKYTPDACRWLKNKRFDDFNIRKV